LSEATQPSKLPPAAAASDSGLIVAEQSETVLNAIDAATALEQLRGRLLKEQDLELTLQWRLRRKST